MFSAIIYNSCTGSCKRYAELISKELSIPAVDLKKASGVSGKVLYIGWLMAGSIMGYKKAKEKYSVAAVAQVGMAPVTESSEAQGRQNNDISPDVPLFCLQGGFDINKLPLHFRLMMKLMNKNIAEKLRAKAEKTELNAQEKATLKMAETGVGEPAAWNIDDVIEWCKAH